MGNVGIISYMERIDGSSLYKPDQLKIGAALVNEKWISPDKKRIYFIPPEDMTYTNEVYFDDNDGLWLDKEILKAKKHKSYINSMKKQMEILDIFLSEIEKEDKIKCDSALYNAQARYWNILDYIESLNLDIDNQRYLISAIEEINKGN